MRNYVKLHPWTVRGTGVWPDMRCLILEFFDDHDKEASLAAFELVKAASRELRLDPDLIRVYRRCAYLPDLRAIGEPGGMAEYLDSIRVGREVVES